jgi:hypothetical protein
MDSIILLHGALGCAEEFVTIEKYLSKKYKCISFNMPLHGDNAVDLPFTIEVFSEYLTNLYQRPSN